MDNDGAGGGDLGPRGLRAGYRVRARNWCVTINNPPGEAESWGNLGLPNFTQYAVWQGERGEEKKTPHIQLYVQCNRAVDLSTLQQWNNRAHFEVARGSFEQNEAYCTKEDGRISGPWRFGEPKQQGRRTDLEEIANDINAGQRMLTIAQKWPSNYMRYYRGIQAYQSILQCPGRPDLRVIIYWGESGAGKTTRAKREFPDAADIPETKEGWLGDYTDEPAILFDDFEGLFPLRSILKLVSHHAHTLPVKGGFRRIRASTIIFTSNTDPFTWYTDGNGSYSEPWHRRLNEPWCTIEYMEREQQV